MGRGWPRLLALGGVALLGGCSGTRFGDQLARSFSAPERTAEPTPAAPARSGSSATTPARSTTVRTTPAAPPPIVRPVPAPVAEPPSTPAPYRVTIRLPAADPSAPAERVTQALRAAGVAFEVETIERMGASGTPPAPLAPVRTPAPAPR